MDSSTFHTISPGDEAAMFEENGDDFPMFFHVRNTLERVSLKKATCFSCFCLGGGLTSGGEYREVPQHALMKMVRKMPRLRWLRSDLTPENITILKSERPEITFVTD
jgi:hypothetical protein